jgi:hypothetical protein
MRTQLNHPEENSVANISHNDREFLDGDMFLFNAGNVLPDYMASHPRVSNLHSHRHESVKSCLTYELILSLQHTTKV